jgi:hypothetical protein
VKRNRLVGRVFAEDIGKEIDVYAKRGESVQQALERVERKHMARRKVKGKGKIHKTAKAVGDTAQTVESGARLVKKGARAVQRMTNASHRQDVSASPEGSINRVESGLLPDLPLPGFVRPLQPYLNAADEECWYPVYAQYSAIYNFGTVYQDNTGFTTIGEEDYYYTLFTPYFGSLFRKSVRFNASPELIDGTNGETAMVTLATAVATYIQFKSIMKCHENAQYDNYWLHALGMNFLTADVYAAMRRLEKLVQGAFLPPNLLKFLLWKFQLHALGQTPGSPIGLMVTTLVNPAGTYQDSPIIQTSAANMLTQLNYAVSALSENGATNAMVANAEMSLLFPDWKVGDISSQISDVPIFDWNWLNGWTNWPAVYKDAANTFNGYIKAPSDDQYVALFSNNPNAIVSMFLTAFNSASPANIGTLYMSGINRPVATISAAGVASAVANKYTYDVTNGDGRLIAYTGAAGAELAPMVMDLMRHSLAYEGGDGASKGHGGQLMKTTWNGHLSMRETFMRWLLNSDDILAKL